MNKVYFNNLGTVKINDTEITINDFVNKMIKSIMTDSIHNNVSYDSTFHRYVIEYDGLTYGAMYGDYGLNDECDNKTVLLYLRQLVNISEVAQEIEKEKRNNPKFEENEERIKEENIQKSYKILDKSIAKEIEKKERKLENIRIETNCMSDLKSDLWDEVAPFLFYGDLDPTYSAGRSIIGGVGVLGLIGALVASLVFGVGIHFMVYVVLGIAIGDGICSLFFTGEDRNHGFKGLWAFILLAGTMLIGSPIWAGIKLFKMLTFQYRAGPIKRAIKRLKKKGINNKIKDRKLNTEELLEKIETNISNNSLSIDDFEELKNNILAIKDEKGKKDLAVRLFELIGNCTDLSQIDDEVFNDLSSDVNEMIQKEKDNEENIKGVYKLMTEIEEKKEEVKENKEEYQKVLKMGK